MGPVANQGLLLVFADAQSDAADSRCSSIPKAETLVKALVFLIT